MPMYGGRLNRKTVRLVAVFCAAALGYVLMIGLYRGPYSTEQDTKILRDMVTVGEVAPDFTVTDIHGNKVQLSQFKGGKVVVLNFWATWCVPCIKEFPALLDVAHRNPESVQLLALSADFQSEAILEFIQKLPVQPGANVTIALDADQGIAQNMYRSNKLPETFVIDKSGLVAAKFTGASWQISEMKAAIEGAH